MSLLKKMRISFPHLSISQAHLVPGCPLLLLTKLMFQIFTNSQYLYKMSHVPSQHFWHSINIQWASLDFSDPQSPRPFWCSFIHSLTTACLLSKQRIRTVQIFRICRILQQLGVHLNCRIGLCIQGAKDCHWDVSAQSCKAVLFHKYDAVVWCILLARGSLVS
jgi:hypothetical protein